MRHISPDPITQGSSILSVCRSASEKVVDFLLAFLVGAASEVVVRLDGGLEVSNGDERVLV